MTASLTIANSSNWDGETIYIEINERFYRIEAGDTLAVPYKSENRVKLSDAQFLRDRDGTKPFLNAENEQTIPYIRIEWSNGEPIRS